MKRTRLRPISEKRLARLKEEMPIRKALAERVGGVYIWDGLKGVCVGGKCEKCGKPPCAPTWFLHPHEEPFKSHGGRVSLEQSRMVCDDCGAKAHGIRVVHSKPQWR